MLSVFSIALGLQCHFLRSVQNLRRPHAVSANGPVFANSPVVFRHSLSHFPLTEDLVDVLVKSINTRILR